MFDNTILLIVVALVFSIISLVANHKIGNRKRVKQLQKEVNDFQKNFEKANKEKDEKEIQRLKVIEPQVMKNMQEMLLLPIKSMIVILPLFFIFIAGIEAYFHGFSSILPIDIHPNSIFALKVFEPAAYGGRGYFIFFTIIFNLVFELVYSNLIEKKNENKSEQKNETKSAPEVKT
ncbi:MAG: EMC3/TMCO1 family protein [Candidatus Micrarchaeota archaeon]